MKSILESTSWGYWVLAAVEAALVWIIVDLGRRTALLRDSDQGQIDPTARIFSLARTQLAFWSTIIIGCYIYLYLKTGAQTGIMSNETVLWLLGISTGTSALSAAAAKSIPPPANINALPPPQPQTHVDFVTDILSDAQGMNLHRLQMAMWTLIFGGVFIAETITKNSFPVFDKEVFALMGISSTTYVWFKRSEA